ncbi:MAG: restriction endonuclease subunit R [Spirulina sp. SIO3F2]|nr:restriction endonuclease subunit R [Spirulina sp. SIO3F2]
MTQTLTAQEVTLRVLRESCGLKAAPNRDFFTEWGVDGFEITPEHRQVLDRVQANYWALMDDPPLLENTVKMVILGPLLDLAGFYRKPFHLDTEPSVELNLTDADCIIRGRIDVLVISRLLWLVVIESKRSDFAVVRALPQTLAYMLASPNQAHPTFGMITNGSEFLFVKTQREADVALYGTSALFSLLNPGNELYRVLAVLRTLGESALAQPVKP